MTYSALEARLSGIYESLTLSLEAPCSLAAELQEHHTPARFHKLPVGNKKDEGDTDLVSVEAVPLHPPYTRVWEAAFCEGLAV